MKRKSILSQSEFLVPFSIATAAFLCVSLLIFRQVLSWNNGVFVYSLDDAYIHLAIVENLLKGHYGVNFHEYSAASSSIIWPFLLVPFLANEYSPLFLNLIFSILSIFTLTKIFERTFKNLQRSTKLLFISSFTTMFVLVTNLIAILFLGMEHSLQITVTLLIVLGLIVEYEENRLPRWFLFTLFLAPLVRYENMAICLPVGLYLFVNGYKKQMFILFSGIVTSLAAFSVFLYSLDLGFLPSSILAKSSTMKALEYSNKYLQQLSKNVRHKTALLLFVNCLFFSFHILMSKVPKRFKDKKNQMALTVIVACLVHIIFGRFSAKQRYEAYIISYAMVLLVYFLGPVLSRFFQEKKSILFALGFLLIANTSLLFVSKKMIHLTATTALGCNNIYEQQYQMHRFVTEYYKKPVGINDLGYVSYKNPNYVLDFAGLASLKALKFRFEKPDSKWMKRLADKKNVELVMIYPAWFKKLPQSWKKVGVLHLGRDKASPFSSKVHFYATDEEAYVEIASLVKDFKKTLPGKSRFVFTDEAINRKKDLEKTNK